MKKTNILRDKFRDSTDEMQRSLSHFAFFSKRWLGLRLGLVNSVLMVVGYIMPIFYLIFLDSYITLSTLSIALSFTWSLKIVQYFNTLVNNIAQLHADIVSYGRLSNYSANAKTEHMPSLKEEAPFADFPDEICYLDRV